MLFVIQFREIERSLKVGDYSITLWLFLRQIYIQKKLDINPRKLLIIERKEICIRQLRKMLVIVRNI